MLDFFVSFAEKLPAKQAKGARFTKETADSRQATMDFSEGQEETMHQEILDFAEEHDLSYEEAFDRVMAKSSK